MKIYKQYCKNSKVSILNKKYINWSWSFKILFLSLALSISFSVLSEVVLNGSTIFFALLVIISFLFVNVLCDLIGVAITAGDINYFESLKKRNVKGADNAILLLKNADKVSVFCCDIIGDICGILSGACGATIVLKIVGENKSNPTIIIVSAVISGLIAGLTIFCKSIEKGYAVKKSEKIILKVAQVLALINRGNKK